MPEPKNDISEIALISSIGSAGSSFAVGKCRAIHTCIARFSVSGMPSMINTSLFSLEKATRASVVLGLVGAGGIGIELKVAMDLFDYDEAATIILAIFALVLAVERASTLVRARVL